MNNIKRVNADAGPVGDLRTDIACVSAKLC
jgi:hypothetical protein